MAAAAGALALWGGCARIDVPEPDSKNAIVFNARMQLLKDDASTKAGTFKEDFEVGDKIAVFGRRHGNNQSTDVFGETDPDTGIGTGTLVEKTSATAWTYSPLKAWYWLTEGDYYDFLGVYPSGKGTVRMDIPGNLAIETHYSISQSNYDLMYALYRRHYGSEADRRSAVPLVFRHTLSAVRIIFDNDSNSQDITINSYQFTHMIVSADAKATMDGIGNPDITWINTTRNSDAVRSVTPTATLAGKGKTGAHRYTGDFDFFIPTALNATSNGIAGNEDYMPHLTVRFTPAGQQAVVETSLLLKDIQRDPLNGDTTPVDIWEPGVRYTYHISIRMDGAVQITVVTTRWEEISAETPGVMID